jgi:VCBS repeat-containing protein/predicted outer membrane repeat protein
LNEATHSIVMAAGLAAGSNITLLTALSFPATKSSTTSVTLNGALTGGSRIRLITTAANGLTSTVNPGSGTTYAISNVDATNLGFSLSSGTLSVTGASLTSTQLATANLVAFTVNAGTLQLTNCAVKDYKRSTGDGAAIAAAASTTVSVTASKFEGCSAVNGGAISFGGTALTLQRAWFASNAASGSGGGVYATAGTLSASRCLWQGNTAASGGGIYAATMTATSIKNSAIVGNTASTSGGGIFTSNARLGMHSVTLLDNAAPTGPAMTYAQAGATGYIANSVLWGSAAAVLNGSPQRLQMTNTLWKGGVNSACTGTAFCSANTLNADPKLSPLTVAQADAGPATFWVPAGDSPVINAGSNDAFNGVTGESVDMRGNRRVVSCAADRGAIEYTLNNQLPTATAPAAYSVNEDTTLTVAAAQGLLFSASDPDACDTLTVSTTPVSGPANGTVTIQANGSFVYVPSSNFSGTDTFAYTVLDGTATVGPITATINVGAFVFVFFLSCCGQGPH